MVIFQFAMWRHLPEGTTPEISWYPWRMWIHPYTLVLSMSKSSYVITGPFRNRWRLEVPTIYKSYLLGLCFREYPHKIWPKIWYIAGPPFCRILSHSHWPGHHRMRQSLGCKGFFLRGFRCQCHNDPTEAVLQRPKKWHFVHGPYPLSQAFNISTWLSIKYLIQSAHDLRA